MKVRYLIIDRNGALTRVSKAQVQDLWNGRISACDLGAAGGNEVRLITVLLDRKLLPKKIYLLRLPLTAGMFTRHSYLTLRIFAAPDCVTPSEMFQHHSEGWPGDFFPQLAVALDVTGEQLNVPLGIGGPLLMAAAMKVTPREAIRYLE
jgi:hypothetical protein